MNKIIAPFIVFIVFVGVVLIGSSIYIVDETQQVVLTQFGKLIGNPKKDAGLYFKVPFVQTVNYFDKRILDWDGDATQIPTIEKRFIWVDTFARWRIVDPLKFMQAMRTEPAAQTRLDDLLDASTRAVISNNQLAEAIRDSNRLVLKQESGELDDYSAELGRSQLEEIKLGRRTLEEKILARSKDKILEFGIELVDFRIKRINYVKEVQNKVYERMISERKRAAEQFRSEGQGKKAEIEGQMTKELEQIQSEAYRQAQELRGKADAQATVIYADAYNKDPEFYTFLRTLESYRKTVNSNTKLILSTDSEFYQFFKSSTFRPVVN